MGVKGLWELLHPVARPIKLETLSNKHLAIDASIWLHQFLRGMRDNDGQAVGNAHIIGFFRRICKLLYFNVKPIFVFDGGTPALKRLTIQERRKRRKHDANLVKRTAEKLLAAQLRLRALDQRKAARKKKAEEKQQSLGSNVVHDSEENPRYFDELVGNTKRDSDKAKLEGVTSRETKEIPTKAESGGGGGVGSQAKRIKDKYVLPPMEVDFETLSRIRNNDIRFGYQEHDDISSFLEQFKKEGGLANIDSEAFKALPSEVQYEILQDIRVRSRVTSYERVQEMVRNSNTAMDFSMHQIQGVIRRNNVTQKLLTVNQAVSKTEVTRPGRIASQRNRQYLIVKNEEGGWALGGRQPTTGMSADKPVQLDSDDDEEKTVKHEIKDEDEWMSDEEEDIELEEVKIPQPAAAPALTQPTHKQSATPKLVVNLDDETSLINHPEAYVDEDESIENVMAKFAEIEDEAARKKSVKAHTKDTTNEDNGLHLIGEKDAIQVQEGARQRLSKAGLQLKEDEQWPEVISDGEEVASMDTMNSLETLNSEDFDNLVEDEQTGEIMSRRAYNKRYGLLEDESNGRALSSDEESRLDREEFHRYWTGYTPDSFKVKHHDHEHLVQDAIYEWEDDRLEGELHSAARKLEKSNVNDTFGVEALDFWKSFLESVLNRRRVQSVLVAEGREKTEEASGAGQTQKGSTVERTSRLSQAIVLDDDDDDGDDGGHDTEVEDISAEEFLLGQRSKLPDNPVSLDSVIESKPLGTMASSTSIPFQAANKQDEVVNVPHRPILDFSSSILKRRAPSAIPEPSTITAPPSTITVPPSTTTAPPSPVPDARVESLVESTPSTGKDESLDVTMDIDVPVTDSGFGSRTLDFEPEDTDMEAVSKANKHSESAGDGMIEESEEKTISADKESEESGATERPKDEEAEVEEEEDDEDEDDMNASDLANEEEDFSKLFNLPGAILNPKEQPSPVKTPPPVRAELSAEEKAALEQQDAKKMVEESRQLQSEIKALQDQHRKHQRDADDLTESMVADTKILLRLFGIPYLVAPMEAEAQCADLQQRGVVDGILTEDSDVFLFGGGRVFKNMFKEEKYVECYLMSDIERDLGVGRDRLVALAYLLGSDYTTGIKGVGLITAMEIIKLFPKLDNFARWWRGEQEKASGEKNTEGTADTDSKSGLTDLELDSIDEVALEKLAKQCKKVHVPSTFPDPHVADAYIHPMVDDDPAEFQWGIPDLDGLRDFLRKALSWDRGEVDQVLLPIIRQMSSQQVSTQTTLDTFFDSTAGMGTFQSPVRKNLHKSARLRKAVDGLTGRSNDDPATDKKEGKSGTTKRAGGKRKATTKKDKRAGSAVHDDDDDDKDDKDESLVDGQADEKVEETTKAGGQDDNESDDEEGFVDELEKKKKQRTSKKTERTPQTKVPESVMAAKRQLKSKDLEVRLAERIKNRAAAAAAAIASSGVEGSSDTRDQPTQRKRTASGSSGDDSGDDGSDRDDDFAPSHWDLLAERQRHLQGQQVQQASPKKGTGLSSGRAPSLSAMVSASNAARYGSSFRNKETDGRAPKRSRRSQGGL